MAGAVACRGRMLMRTCQRGGGGICLGVKAAGWPWNLTRHYFFWGLGILQ